MIDAIKRLIAGPDDAPGRDDHSTELAAAALMVQAALSDGVYADVESDMILDLLKSGFDLDDAAARDLLNEAEGLAETALDHYQFTKVIKELPEDRRMAFMTQLWRVALADGEKDAHEDALFRRLSPLLALTDRQRAEARQAAQGEN
jgi:uncharacterized tellurite resistance protein B-like protein